MQIAIITGASSGLGKVFFEKTVERYPQLDEYWVIARSENKLKELADNALLSSQKTPSLNRTMHL